MLFALPFAVPMATMSSSISACMCWSNMAACQPPSHKSDENHIFVKEYLEFGFIFLSSQPLGQVLFVRIVFVWHISRITAIAYLTHCVHQPVRDESLARVPADFIGADNSSSRNDDAFACPGHVVVCDADPIDLRIPVLVRAMDMDNAHIGKKRRDRQ